MDGRTSLLLLFQRQLAAATIEIVLTIDFDAIAMTKSACAIFGLFAAFILAAVITWSLTTISVNSDSRPVLLFTGDSLTEKGTDPATEGWVTLLQARYTRSTNVLARGFSGYNTKRFLKDVVPLIAREIWTEAYDMPSLITVWLGANDAALWNGSNSESYVPIEEYKEDLKQIVIELSVAAPTAYLLLITPPHVNDTARAEIAEERNDTKRGLVDRSNETTKQYAQACVETATVIGVPVLDLNTYFNAMPEATRDALLVDGLHFNIEGNKVVAEQVRGRIAAEFPRLDDDIQA